MNLRENSLSNYLVQAQEANIVLPQVVRTHRIRKCTRRIIYQIVNFAFCIRCDFFETIQVVLKIDLIRSGLAAARWRIKF